MSSSAVNVANPIATPTSVQLCQIAANIAGTMFSNIQNGNYEDVYQHLRDLCAAVNCLAQSGLTVNNTTASSVGTVTVRSAYALGAAAVIPTNINTATI